MSSQRLGVTSAFGLIRGVTIGASTTTFTVIHGVLLRALPVPKRTGSSYVTATIQRGGPLGHGPVFSAEFKASQEWDDTLEITAGHSFFRIREYTAFDDGQPLTPTEPEVSGESFAAVAGHDCASKEFVGRWIKLGGTDAPGEWMRVSRIVGDSLYRGLVIRIRSAVGLMPEGRIPSASLYQHLPMRSLRPVVDGLASEREHAQMARHRL